MSFSVGKQQEEFIKMQVESGRYNNASEVVRAALRLLEDHEAEKAILREKIRQSLELGGENSISEVRESLKS